MSEERIPTDIWVTAHIRQCAAKGIPVYVSRKGAYAAGTVMLKIVMRGKGCILLNQARDLNGVLGWMKVFDDEGHVDEKQADEYIARSVKRDPDLWVIEVEDESGANPFEGKIF